MQTIIVPEQVKTQKIQAGVQVSRLEDKDVIFSIGSALEDFILKKTSIDTGTSLISKSYGTLNDATPRVDVAKEVVSPSMIDDTVEKEKLSPVVTTIESYPPLPTQVTTSAGNAPGKSSYANVTGKPSGKKLNFRTLFTRGGNGIDVAISMESIRIISK
ncbi:hypothetical protein Tco_1340840 [Tanacetum coccineum]